jgi:hypothetical protein
MSSLVSFREGWGVHFRLFSCLLGLTFFVESFAVWIGRSFHFNPFVRGYTTWGYTLFLLMQFWIYGYFFYRVISALFVRRIIFFFLVGFPLFWLGMDLFLLGFSRWDPYVPIVGSFFTIVFVLMYYFQLITGGEQPPLRGVSSVQGSSSVRGVPSIREVHSVRGVPEFWIATGMLLFYLGALPYFGTLDFLMHHHLLAGRGGMVNMVRGLDVLMYGLIGYGYWCGGRGRVSRNCNNFIL